MAGKEDEGLAEAQALNAEPDTGLESDPLIYDDWETNSLGEDDGPIETVDETVVPEPRGKRDENGGEEERILAGREKETAEEAKPEKTTEEAIDGGGWFTPEELAGKTAEEVEAEIARMDRAFIRLQKDQQEAAAQSAPKQQPAVHPPQQQASERKDDPPPLDPKVGEIPLEAYHKYYLDNLDLSGVTVDELGSEKAVASITKTMKDLATKVASVQFVLDRERLTNAQLREGMKFREVDSEGVRIDQEYQAEVANWDSEWHELFGKDPLHVPPDSAQFRNNLDLVQQAIALAKRANCSYSAAFKRVRDAMYPQVSKRLMSKEVSAKLTKAAKKTIGRPQSKTASKPRKIDSERELIKELGRELREAGLMHD